MGIDAFAFQAPLHQSERRQLVVGGPGVVVERQRAQPAVFLHLELAAGQREDAFFVGVESRELDVAVEELERGHAAMHPAHHRSEFEQALDADLEHRAPLAAPEIPAFRPGEPQGKLLGQARRQAAEQRLRAAHIKAGRVGGIEQAGAALPGVNHPQHHPRRGWVEVQQPAGERHGRSPRGASVLPEREELFPARGRR